MTPPFSTPPARVPDPWLPDGQPGYYTPGAPPTSLGNQIREWIDILARGRWMILAAVLAIGIPVAIYAFLAPDVYEASTKLFVETGSSEALGAVLPGSDGDILGADRGVENELYILQNAELLAEKTAEGLLDRADAAAGPAMTILRPDASGALPSVKAVAARVGTYLEVSQDGGANGIRVSAKSRVPEEAALIANLYAQAYVDRTQNSSRASVTASREFLESQSDSVAVQLAEREEATRTYMNREGAVRLDEEAASLVSQLAALEAERDQARVEAGMQSSRIAELRAQVGRLEGTVASRLGSTADRDLAQDEARLAAVRDRLESIYLRDPSLRSQSPAPADVTELRRQIDTLERRVSDANARRVAESMAAGGVDAATSGLPRLSALRDQLTEAEVSLSGLRSRVSLLTDRIASRQGELAQIPSQSVELARLMRDRQSAERLALGLDQKLQEARVAESAELGYAEIIRTATTPHEPIGPNRLRMTLLGLLLGLGLGIALAVGRAQLDQTIRRPAHLKDLGYPQLGVVPDVTDLIAEDFGGAETYTVYGREVDTHLVTMLSPMSTASEAFRGLRTSVQFSRPDTVIETLLVTSASPGEGKSTVAANLAVVMAQAGRRTLLVDADLRRPRVHHQFGINRLPGLSDALNGGDLEPVPVADDLYVLPAGALVPNPAEHLGSAAFRDLVARLRESYDMIIFDAPPVMAATDPVLLSTQMDGTILVASSGKTKTFELQYADEELQRVGARTIGVVLNGFDVSSEYGYRYQYAYQYGSKYSYGNE